MKNIPMLAAGLATAGWLAACSAPAPTTDAHAGAPKGRDIELIQSPVTQAASVSDLEAGRLPKPRPNRPIERQLADEPVPPAKVEPTPDQQSLAAPVAETEMVHTASVAVAAPQEEVVEVRDRGVMMSIPTPGDDYPALGSGSLGLGRRPGIMIRGGRGGLDDDCDLDRPGAHGMHPMAINRVGPATPGDQFGSGTSRVGGRSGGMSGFPRGGIR